MQKTVLQGETPRRRDPYATRVVERAVDLLFCLSKSDRPLGVSELALHLGLSKATVFRLLQTLAGKGLVTQDSKRGTYLLTPRVLSLGLRFIPQRLTLVSRPYLQELRDASKETATLSIRVGDERVFLEVVPSPLEVRMVPEAGKAVPLHRGASGKVLLAFAEPEVRARVMQTGLRTLGAKGVADLEAQIEQIRRQGVASSVQERTPGAASIAAAVRDGTGAVIATLALSAPVGRFGREAMQRLVPFLVDVAGRLSRDLGCPSPLAGGARR